MKKIIAFLAIVFLAHSSLYAQNVFPTPTGNTGIGTTSPQAPLHMYNNERNYYVNRFIRYVTEDSGGKNYLLLHPFYRTDTLAEHYVMGKVHAVRGSKSSSNRKISIEINTSSANRSNIGTIVAYNEMAYLVTCTFNGTEYLAVEIQNGSSLYNVMFTGHASTSATLQFVYDQEVSNVAPFTPNTIGIQGPLATGKLHILGVAAIGGDGSTGTNKLTVDGTISARKVKVTQATPWPDFVFSENYTLPPLDSVATFVQTHKHLPGIPSEADIKKDGHDLGDMNARLLQKVEELTLYLIEMKKENSDLKKRLEKLENK